MPRKYFLPEFHIFKTDSLISLKNEIDKSSLNNKFLFELTTLIYLISKYSLTCKA